MMNARKLFWALGHPRAALKSVTDRAGYPSYKRYVGPPELWDVLGRHQFELLLFWGLRPGHFLLDVGCGSLRAGRFLISYLDPGNYFGIEPNGELLREGIRHNLDEGTLRQKSPTFSHDHGFNLSAFGRKFDFILAHSIFTHAAQHQISKCFREARSVMSTTSLIFANYNRGGGDYAGEEWVYPGYVRYTFARISTLAGESGLGCRELGVEHPTGGTWLLAYDPATRAALAERIGQQGLPNPETRDGP